METSANLQRFGDVELNVRSSGSGMPFVWCHSLLGSMDVEDRARLWDWEAIASHAQVVRYDARGHGQSQGSYDKEDYQWERMARDMLAVGEAYASSNRSKRFMLGGISMGAATALDAALQAPGKVAGLVLALPPTARETRPRQAAVYRRLARVSGLLGATPFRLLGLLPVPVREDGRSQLAVNTMKDLGKSDPRHVQAVLGGAALSDIASEEQLRGLDVPTLILAWEDDPAHPLSSAEHLADTLPDVRELVVCHPTDIGSWQPALADFVYRITTAKSRGRVRGHRRSARG